MSTNSTSRIKAQFIRMISYLEDYIDKKAIKDSNLKRGRDFGKVAKELGI